MAGAAGDLDIAYDAAGDRVIAVSAETTADADAVFAISLATGIRSVLSPSAPPRIESGRDVMIDASANRALVTHIGTSGLIAVDLATGARSELTRATTPAPEPQYGAVSSVTLDRPAGRLLALMGNEIYLRPEGDRIMAIDGRSGARSPVVDPGGGPALRGFLGVDAGIAYVFDAGLADDIGGFVPPAPARPAELYRVDLRSGARTRVATGLPLSTEATAFDFARNRVLVFDQNRFGFAVDLSTGASTPFSTPTSGSRASTSDASLRFDVRQVHTVVSDDGTILLITSRHIQRNPPMTDGFNHSVFTVDPDTGEQTLLSRSVVETDCETPLSTADGFPRNIPDATAAICSFRNTPVVRGTELIHFNNSDVFFSVSDTPGGVVAVDLTTGARRALPVEGLGVPSLPDPVLSLDGETLFGQHPTDPSILQYDPETGHYVTFSR